jgi:hypothetical protein
MSPLETVEIHQHNKRCVYLDIFFNVTLNVLRSTLSSITLNLYSSHKARELNLSQIYNTSDT